MKQIYLAIIAILFSVGVSNAQCAQACGQYSLSTITYSAFPNTGTFVTLGDDDTTGFVNIGFNFNFYCSTYNKVKICSNGFITFDNAVFTTSSTPYAQQLPSAVSPNAVIAYNWNDLDPSAGGTIGYNTIGTSPNQTFIVTYSNVPLWSYGGSNTGQIVLYEADNSIEVHIGNAINNGFLTHTEGIENLAATNGVPVPGRNLTLWTASVSAHRWEKPILGTPPTGISGNTVACFGEQGLIYMVNSMPGATSYSWTAPGGWGGTSTTTALTATAGISGLMMVTATYSCGVSAASTLSVTVNPAPFINITSVTPPSICSGSVVTINASGGASYTLDPVGITGIPPFSFTAAANTAYSLSATGVNGCPSLSPAIVPLTVYESPTVSVNSGSICLGETFTMTPSGASTYSYSSLFSSVTPPSAGTYSYLIIGTATNACVGYAVSVLTVNTVPNVTAFASRPLICVKESSTLTAQGGGTYSWVPNNSSSTVIPISPTVTTVYTVTGTNPQGCSMSVTVAVVVSPCTGIGENGSDARLLSVFPNPASGELTINLQHVLSIALFDLTGREMWSGKLESGTHKLNLSAYPAGVYLLKASGGAGETSLRIVKE